MNFLKIAEGVDVRSLLAELKAQPFLWNKNPCRLSKRGPHYETDDIFLRYKDETANFAKGDFSDFGDAHFADWYKSIEYLPSAKKIIFDLMATVNGEQLGGVFLYRVAPGAKIHPHKDIGWHGDYYNKFNICLQSNQAAAFCYEEDAMVQRQGDVHMFRNDVTHWVVNEGTEDHIIMTVCIRMDSGYRVPWSPEGWTMDQFLDERDRICQHCG